MTEQVPPRFSEKSFRRYESIIYQVVERYPSPTTVDLGGLSAETVSSRLRDAINAFLRPDCSWTSAINRVKLHDIWDKIQVTNQGTHVRVGIKEDKQFIKMRELEMANTAGIEFTAPTDVELSAICVLLNCGKTKLVFRLTNSPHLNQKYIDSIQAQFPNVVLKQDEHNPNEWLML